MPAGVLATGISKDRVHTKVSLPALHYKTKIGETHLLSGRKVG